MGLSPADYNNSGGEMTTNSMFEKGPENMTMES
jgi:hypothetical protein